MSASIVRGGSLGTRVTRQDLYDLVANSQLKDVDVTALSVDARTRLVLSASDPPAMAHGQLWWDMREQLMRCFDSNLSYAFAVGPDRFESPGLAACPIVQGACVRIDPVLCYSAYGNDLGLPWIRPISNGMEGVHTCGIVTESAASGAVVPVARGIAPAAFTYSLPAELSTSTPITPASGQTGLVGCMDPSETSSGQTEHWAVGYLLEIPFASATSCYSRQLYVDFVGPFRVRNIA